MLLDSLSDALLPLQDPLGGIVGGEGIGGGGGGGGKGGVRGGGARGGGVSRDMPLKMIPHQVPIHIVPHHKLKTAVDELENVLFAAIFHYCKTDKCLFRVPKEDSVSGDGGRGGSGADAESHLNAV